MLGVAAKAYHQAGWHPLELPAAAKAPPPPGRTGHDGVDMTADEIAVADWAGNIGLRMPVDVIGLDVDAYDGKPGLDTLEELTEELGPLPLTWRSSSRDDGLGIFFYRAPAGYWVPSLPGIEIIQRGHRYAVVWPSRHPQGRPYRWYDMKEQAATEDIPDVDDLPELPWPWIAHLSRDTSERTSSRPADPAAASEFLKLRSAEADAPAYLETAIVAEWQSKRAAGHSRHDTMQHCLTWAMDSAAAGLIDADMALTRLGDLWTAAHPTDARRAALAAAGRTTEFQAMVAHAIGRATAKTPGELARLHDDIAGIKFNAAAAPGPESEPEALTDPRTGEPVRDELLREVHRQLVLVEGRDIAKAILTEREFEPPPQPRSIGWLLAHPPPDTKPRITRVLPADGRAVLVAPRKVGKTTTVVNVLRSLALGEKLFNKWDCAAGRTHVLNYEVTGWQFAAWCHEAGVPDDVMVSNLRGGPNPFLTDRGRKELVAQLHGADVLIVDPFSAASSGMVEREADNAAIRAWLALLDEVASAAGIREVVLTVHGSFKAEDPDTARGGTALEDWPDVIWRLSKDDTSGDRFFAATGRDVDVPQDKLTFNPQNRRLSLGLTPMNKTQAKYDRFRHAVIDVVTRQPGIGYGALQSEVRRSVEGFGNNDTFAGYIADMAADHSIQRVDLGPGHPTKHYPAGVQIP